MVVRRLLFFATAITILIAANATAHAQDAAGTLDQITAQFQQQANAIGPPLQRLAYGTFWTLAFIDFAWAIGGCIRRGSEGLDLFAELINEIMMVGIFFAMLSNSLTWGGDIINSFRQAAGVAGAGAMTPSTIFTAGLNMASKLFQQSSLWHPERAIVGAIAALLILYCFVRVSAVMIACLVESYMIVAGGTFLMAFGGSRWTNDVAIGVYRYCAAVGAKLMMLQLIANIGVNFATQWANSFSANTDTPMLIVIGCSIVLMEVSKIVPDTFMRLVEHASLATGSQMINTTIGVGAGAAAAGLATAGFFPAAGAAFRLSRAQMAESGSSENGGEQKPILTRAALITAGAARNFAGAAASDVGRRLSGQGGRYGSATWRMSADMRNRARMVMQDAGRPKPQGNTISGSNP